MITLIRKTQEVNKKSKSLRYLAAISALALYCCSLIASATDIYVDNNAIESGDGSLQRPYQTIQECANVAMAGDTCFIREGIYRETVILRNSGAPGSPITFTAYHEEDVLISGFDQVLAQWENHSNNVWKTSLPEYLGKGRNQIFIDGEVQIDARWPNMPDSTVTVVRDDHAISEAGTHLSSDNNIHTGRYSHAGIPDWSAGAIMTFAPGKEWWPFLGDVKSVEGDTIEFTFARNGGIEHAVPAADDPFMLWGKLEALDDDKEFFVDVEGNYGDAGTLYVYGNPDTKSLEVKTRGNAITMRDDVRDIHISNIRIKGGTVFVGSRSQGVVIDSIEILYGTYNMWTGWSGAPVYLRGDGNQLINSRIQYSGGESINLLGDNLVVRNNIFAHGGYNMTASGTAVIVTRDSFNATIENNTIFNHAGGIQFSGAKASSVSYNHVFNIGHQTTDISAINSYNGGDGYGTEISYNLVHDIVAYYNQTGHHNGGSGIRLDSGAAPVGHCNWTIHHNIIYNTTKDGLQIFGNEPWQLQACNADNFAANSSNNLIYNNTADSTFLLFRGNNAGTQVKNNLFTKGLDGNAFNADMAANNFHAASFVDQDSHNYQLRGNALAVDGGVHLPPYTDGYLGASPDMGAMEYGAQSWVAGALIGPQHLSNLTVSCDASSEVCGVFNLPVGRKLPADFAILIGGMPASRECFQEVQDLETGIISAQCAMAAGSLTGVQNLAVKLNDSSEAVSKGEVDFGNALVIHSVSPSIVSKNGGDSITVTGQHFDSAAPQAFQKRITVRNDSAQPLADYPVLLRIDTHTLIDEGKLNSDCSDLRFSDEYAELSFWLDAEKECNRPDSKIWVKMTRVDQGTNHINMSYGLPERASASSCTDTFIACDQMDDGQLDRIFRESRVNDGNGLHLAEESGEIRIYGKSNANRFVTAGFSLNGSFVDYPREPYAVDFDVRIADLGGATRWKANFGGKSNQMDLYNGGTDIGYWQSGWVNLGTSEIGDNFHQWNTFSAAVNRELGMRYYLENGNLRASAVHTTQVWHELGFAPQRNDIQWDVRVDNYRIRKFSPDAIEPVMTAISEELKPQGFSVTMGNRSCTDVQILSDAELTCTVPDFSDISDSQQVDITLVNASGEQAVQEGALTLVTPVWVSDITVLNETSIILTDYQVNVQLDTRALIAAGKMDEACSSIGFEQNGQALDFWLDGAKECNKPDTSIWVKVPVLDIGNSNIAIRYSRQVTGSASNCQQTFYFCDEFSDNSMDNYLRKSYVNQDIHVNEVNEELRINGQSDSAKYTPAGFTIDWRHFRYPSEPYSLDVDVRLHELDGATKWKANFGGINNQLDIFNGGADIGFWRRGEGWYIQGSSTIGPVPADWNTFSNAFVQDSRTIYYFENGSLRGTAAHSMHMWHQLGFAPQKNGVAWDVRVDNLRIRKFNAAGLQPEAIRISSPILSLY